MTNAELRLDRLTGRHVIVAPTRANRPNAVSSDPPMARVDDPFESGREAETPGESWALRIPGSEANRPGWQVRIVPNRYPILDSPQSNFEQSTKESGVSPQPLDGIHDVVIECPDRRNRLIELGVDELQEVFRAWQIRIRDFEEMQTLRSLVIFRNEGFSAGASLAHCHSQIIATTTLLPELAARQKRADDFRMSTGDNLSESWLKSERSEGSRIISESERLTALCPFASRVGWQCTIVPRRRCDWKFTNLTEEMLRELTVVFRRCHSALIRELGHFSFNLLLVHAPLLDESRANVGPVAAPEFPWMLEIVPRLSRVAGWELLTGIEIVTTSPEDAAARLRYQLAHLSEHFEQPNTGRPELNGLKWIRSGL